jgi:hypothetical protein
MEKKTKKVESKEKGKEKKILRWEKILNDFLVLNKKEVARLENVNNEIFVFFGLVVIVLCCQRLLFA